MYCSSFRWGAPGRCHCKVERILEGRDADFAAGEGHGAVELLDVNGFVDIESIVDPKRRMDLIPDCKISDAVHHDSGF